MSCPLRNLYRVQDAMEPRPDLHRPSVLLTGFGPFPGTPLNASALLVEMLAHMAGKRWPDADIHAATLPTEWRRGIDKLDALWSRHAPDIALHFGVADRGTGFDLERYAWNACCANQDACGETAGLLRPNDDGPDTRATTLPLERIATMLTNARLPNCISGDAGRYLCNAVFYRSLTIAEATEDAALAGFIHIPSSLVGGGANGQAPSPACPLDWSTAQAGAALIVDAAIAHWRLKRSAKPAVVG